jgi:hypothetical protein
MAGIPEGQLYALTNRLEKGDGTTVKLSKGSQVRLYMPSHMAYGEDGYSDNQGYGGQYSLGATKIVVDDLTVVDVVEDPVARETELVEAHAATWDLTAEDTFGFNEEIYVDSVKFEQLLQQERPELLAEYPILPRKTGVAKDDNGNVVKDDEGNDKIVYTDYYSLNTQSTASIRYVGRFLPSPEYPEGFIFDTNIESVYDKFYNRRKGYPAIEQEFPALEYTPSTDKEELIFAFYELVPNVRRGKWYRMVFTSEYGYGGDGLSSGSASYASGKRPTTEISPYTPLVFEIYIEPVSESESK